MSQGKDLEASTVRDNRLLPVDKIVQSASSLHNFRTRLQEKMIRVTKHELHAGRLRVIVVDRFERPICAHCNKCRRIDDTMGRVQPSDTSSRAGLARLMDDLEPEE